MVRLVRFVLYLWMRIFHGLQFHGLPNVPQTGPLLVAANHPSYFDPVVLSLATGRLVRFRHLQYWRKQTEIRLPVGSLRPY